MTRPAHPLAALPRDAEPPDASASRLLQIVLADWPDPDLADLCTRGAAWDLAAVSPAEAAAATVWTSAARQEWDRRTTAFAGPLVARQSLMAAVLMAPELTDLAPSLAELERQLRQTIATVPAGPSVVAAALRLAVDGDFTHPQIPQAVAEWVAPALALEWLLDDTRVLAPVTVAEAHRMSRLLWARGRADPRLDDQMVALDASPTILARWADTLAAAPDWPDAWWRCPEAPPWPVPAEATGVHHAVVQPERVVRAAVEAAGGLPLPILWPLPMDAYAPAAAALCQGGLPPLPVDAVGYSCFTAGGDARVDWATRPWFLGARLAVVVPPAAVLHLQHPDTPDHDRRFAACLAVVQHELPQAYPTALRTVLRDAGISVLARYDHAGPQCRYPQEVLILDPAVLRIVAEGVPAYGAGMPGMRVPPVAQE